MKARCIERTRGRVVTQTCPDKTITAYIDGRKVGVVDIETARGAIVVATAEVVPGARRSGVGTALYEAALALACQTGLALRSDAMRSPYAEAFWRKQASKGRAQCLPGKGVFYDDPSYKRLSPEEKALLPRSPDGDSWDCRQYEIPPCGASSLDGVRRRRRRR